MQLATLVLALGCAPTPPPAGPAVARTESAGRDGSSVRVDAPVAVEPAEARAIVSKAETDNLRTDIPLLDELACWVDTDREEWLDLLALRVDLEEEPFAWVGDVQGRLALAATEADGARFRVEQDGWALRGRVASNDIALTSALALTAGVVTPKPRVRLDFLGGAEDQARVGLIIDEHVQALAQPRYVWLESCANLGLSATDFDVRKPRKLAEFTGQALLGPGEVALRAEPTGAITRLRLLKEVRVAVHERLENQTRVVYDGRSALVVGWVESTVLRAVESQPGSGHGRLGRRAHGIGLSSVRRVLCDGDLELLTQRKESWAIVGAVRAGTPVELGTELGSQTRIGRVPAWLHPRHDLLVPTARLRTCKPAP